ncbi:Band 4.1-like protein 4 [Elysia marginata]|uniref:Band 4.1-like protein 4 n=1 Tax=Elysia marginata TaxID=1093978 RepID=A0AAV4EG95_9GAST|nr:Band 4.1-like protein 4 [Elysia marginata]
MSKGSRLSRLLPKFFRSDTKAKDGHSVSDLKGPYCSIVFLDDTNHQLPYKHWLDAHKSISSQLKGCTVPVKFYFGVKFYAADPCKLREEITRYLFFLQVKRDILQGRLPVSFDEAAELCGYALQSELGDFEPRVHTAGYVSEFCFVPNQTEELEARISGIHQRCVGATPIMAEHRFLEKVQWLEMYGVDLHPVQGESSVEYFLGLTPTGIVVYKHKSKVASYFWPRVTKSSQKGKMFMLKVKDKSNDDHLYAFELSTKAACKHLWKCSVEHHTFFSGRSERLAAMEGRWRPQPSVARAPSRRRSRRVNSDSRINDQAYQDQYFRNRQGMVTVMGQPEPVRAPRHRSLPELHGRQSPRSIKSAPWESNYDYGLYTSGHDSPSASAGRRDPRHASFVSGGSDSESGISQRKRYFPGRKGSDNESDGSASRRRRRERDSDSGSEVSFTMANKGRKKRNPNGPIEFKNFDSHLLYPFHDKENNQNGSIPSLHSAPAGELKQRRRRRRSKSPGNNKRPPEELKQHIEFDLIDTEGMTEEQLRDITYTKVETKANLFRVKYSPKFRQKIWASRRKSFGDADRNSAPSRTNLTRQESYNTDPAGNYPSRDNQDLYLGGQKGYSNSPNTAGMREDESQTGRGSDWSAPSPRSDRSAGRSSGFGGYSSVQSSKAYHNPVYLGHRDAVAATSKDSNDYHDSSKYGNNTFDYDKQHGHPSRNQSQYRDNYGQRQSHNDINSNNSSRDNNQNRFNYQGQYQNFGPSSPRHMRYDNDSRGRSNYQSPGRYNQPYVPSHQSPYDADVSRGDSRLDDSRVDQRLNHRTTPAMDNLRIESRGYGATLHRHSAGVPYNSSHAMNTSSSGPGNVSSQHQTKQMDQRSSHYSYMGSPDPKLNRNSYEDGNRLYGSSPPRNMSRSNYNQQLSAAVQSQKQSYGLSSSPGSHAYSNNRPFNYANSPGSQAPAFNGHSGQCSSGPQTGYNTNTNQARYTAGSMSAQQHSSRDSYGAYNRSPRPQSQPHHYGRSSGSHGRGPMYPDQTPLRSTSDNRPAQRTGFHSDLVTQL